MKQSDADLDQIVLFCLYSVFCFSPSRKMVDAISLKGYSMMECRINTISLQYYVQKMLSVDICRTLLGSLSLLSFTPVSSPYFGDLSLCPIQASHPPLRLSLLSAFLFQLPSTVLWESDVCIPHHYPLSSKFSVSNHFLERRIKNLSAVSNFIHYLCPNIR